MSNQNQNQNQSQEQNQVHEINRENEWFAKRMTITTKQGMLRQYQLEELERGYKIQTLEFKSPAYILKNFIYTNSRKPHRSLTGLRHMQGRNAISAAIGNVSYLVRSNIWQVMPAPPARHLFVLAAALLLVMTGAIASLVEHSVGKNIQGNIQGVESTEYVRHAKHNSMVSSLHQKKFSRELRSTL